MDVSKFITDVASRRKSSILQQWSTKASSKASSINFAIGMPNADTFPMEEITVTYNDGTKVKLVGQELSQSLQYGPCQGHLPLQKKIREFQEYWHKPKYPDWDIHIISGSLDGCTKVFEMTLEPGDPVMVQVPTYTGILHALGPLVPDFIGIRQDDDGIIPEEITRVFEERLRDKRPLPKVIYVNPTGANPTGTVLPNSRKKKIYELSQKYDFLILEDDAFFFLHFLDERPKSFLEFDTKGRVIRFDSFSKIFSAGLRLGVVTAHRGFIEKLIAHAEVTSVHAASLSQMLLYKFLETRDMETLQQHFDTIRRFYRERRDIMLAIIQKHLAGLVEYVIPKGGMFVWMKVIGLDDVMDLAANKCSSRDVLFLPGHAHNYDLSQPDQYIRLSYTNTSAEEMEKGISILAKMLREEINEKTRRKS
ncbi:kynurenine/alpha-aminoadipate aminotransferase, mitochondrial-like [Hylaeus anthracinus]|uniref:kynurenine/alpha-aminoadipate aminotransferase, mitochondrial-like n=1 Tax=Hylaeus anthracinus TaxID=313031 RepID=UPI0023B9F34F|nr:kynurenine/alpha-aminoadipate aminotransferase, mitochondrial-like [Hylaeus anthracinus]